ncbi:MAG TPA: hypothetical protein VKT52_12645 [Ktedonobacterales bacterium]|nr:hypothetical protein [Ktedonobacterales bacterium]
MANVPLHFSAAVRDGLLTAAPITSYLLVPDSTTLAALVGDLGTWASAVDACIDGAIIDVSARLTPDLPAGLKAATGATWLASRVEQTGAINFSATGSDRRYAQPLVSLSNSVIAGGKIDLSNAAIVALVSLLTNPANDFTNQQSQALEAALDALISFRQRAGLPKTSFET